MTERVRCEIEEGKATIVLDDGKLNVMSPQMLDDIDRALETAEKLGSTVVLRSGRPDIFSAGFDLKVIAANDAQQTLRMVKAGGELALRLMSYPYPTIGVVEGHAFPMGTFLLLACDVRIASEGSQRMGLNEVAIGISPPAFAIELARSRMHPAWLNRTVALGEMFEPEDALKAGLLDKVVPQESLQAVLLQTLAAISAISIPSHTIAKRQLRAATMANIRRAIDEEMTIEAYMERSKTPSTVVLPGSG